MNKRKGFIKLALLQGKPIIPCVAFGLDGSYGYWKPESAFLIKVSRWIGFTPLIFWGRWNVPLFIPRPKKITVVVGKPIHVEKCKEDEIKDRIDAVHKVWVTEMKALWDGWRGECGYEGREVVVV